MRRWNSSSESIEPSRSPCWQTRIGSTSGSTIRYFRERFYQFLVPVVSLSPDTGKANIVNIFERINRTGVSLSLFDLAVARLYLKDVKLRNLWNDFRKDHKEAARVIQPDAVLKVIALLEGKETKRSSLLDTVDALDRWYWASVFTQRYDRAVDTAIYGDVRDVSRWLEGAEPPTWLAAVNPGVIDPDVDERRSALYRGLMCLIVLRGARDFCTGQAVPLHECEDDHIFPRAKFRRHARANSILNRTQIYRECNRSKADKLPSEYLRDFERSHGGNRDRLRQTLASHFISDEALGTMERDDIDGFTQVRRADFLAEIGSRIGGVT